MIKNIKIIAERLNNLSFASTFLLRFGIAVAIVLILTSLVLLVLENTVFVSGAGSYLLENSVITAVSVFAECFIFSVMIDIYKLKNDNR